MTSCYSANFKHAGSYKERIIISPENISEFNGVYKTESERSNLQNVLLNKEIKNKTEDRFIKLEILSKELIEVSVIYQDQIIKQQVLNYELQDDNYIKIKVPNSLSHVGWGFMAYTNRVTRITLNYDKNLIVDSQGMVTAIFLVLPVFAGDNYSFDQEHVRIVQQM